MSPYRRTPVNRDRCALIERGCWPQTVSVPICYLLLWFDSENAVHCPEYQASCASEVAEVRFNRFLKRTGFVQLRPRWRNGTDEGLSTMAAIRVRMGAKENLVSNYKTRLVDAGIIETVGHGTLRFAIPGLREHLSTGGVGSVERES